MPRSVIPSVSSDGLGESVLCDFQESLFFAVSTTTHVSRFSVFLHPGGESGDEPP